MQSFDPPKDTQDINAKFMAFAKSRMGAQRAGNQDSDDWGRQASDNRFAEKWALDERAMDRLRQLPLDVQDEVKANFSPKPGSANYSSLFMAYVQKTHGQAHKADGVTLFARDWGLNEDSVSELRNAPENVQEFVIDTFNPSDRGSADINSRFLKFLHMQLKPACRYHAKGYCKDGSACRFRHAPEIEAHTPRSSQSREDTRPDCKYYAKGYCREGDACKFRHESKDDRHQARDNSNRGWESSSYRNDSYGGHGRGRDKVEEFRKKWGLEESAVTRLRELHWEEQESIMSSFNPLGGVSTSHMNAKFVAFVRSRSGRSDGYDQDAPAWKKQRQY